MIEIEDLKFQYNKGTPMEIQALNGVNLSIKKGEFIAILGHNGCGKSTLAKHINALLLPTEGNVLIEGMNTKDQEKLWDIRKTCGMVFQNPDNQLVATVVEEEVAFGPENIGVPTDEIRKRIENALCAVGIGGMEKASSNLLSGGQKQRLAIAGIIAMQPDYIILDEATSMLDPRGRKEVLKIVKRLNKEESITIVFITHSMEEAALADRIIVMENGKIAFKGAPKEVFIQVDKMKKLRLDSPPMTKLANQLQSIGIEIPGDILTIDEMVEALVSILKPEKEN